MGHWAGVAAPCKPVPRFKLLKVPGDPTTHLALSIICATAAISWGPAFPRQLVINLIIAAGDFPWQKENVTGIYALSGAVGVSTRVFDALPLGANLGPT